MATMVGLPPPHAAAAATRASNAATFLGAETWGSVPISESNAILRSGLRFRYHPRSEAGHQPSPPKPTLGGVPKRTAGAARSVFGFAGIEQTLNLAEAASDTVSRAKDPRSDPQSRSSADR